jgi:hypothetical protein
VEVLDFSEKTRAPFAVGIDLLSQSHIRFAAKE